MTTVFFDVDTQIDFLYPAGALYAPGAEKIVGHIAALNHCAEARGIPLVSTMDAHSEDDPEFKNWPPHCVAGTAGQQKPASTLLERRTVLANTANAALDFDGTQQILLEKQTLDCFATRHLAKLLDRLGAERYVVYGVVTEVCVKFAVEGLLKTGKRIELVTDAVRAFNAAAGAEMTAAFLAAGGVLTTVDAVTCG